jgi:hypothetical protein
MTTYTGSELAVRVLKDLGLVGSEETPSAADQTWAEETCDAEISLLAAKGIPVWNGGEDDIPQEYLTVLSRRIGLALAPSFGLSDVATATLAMRAAEDDLRIIGTVPATGKVQEAEYF